MMLLSEVTTVLSATWQHLITITKCGFHSAFDSCCIVDNLVSVFTDRMIILIQESYLKGLVGLHTCRGMLKVKRYVSCYVRHLMPV